MQKIIIKEITKEAASQSSGEKLFNILEPLVKNETHFCVDFDGVTRFASPFFNNSFARLALSYGFEVVNSIEIISLSVVGRDTFDTSMENAQLLSNDPQFASKIEEIINRNLPKRGEWYVMYNKGYYYISKYK